MANLMRVKILMRAGMRKLEKYYCGRKWATKVISELYAKNNIITKLIDIEPAPSNDCNK